MLEVKDLVKTFGNYTAVDHVSFQIPDGKIMGLIGQNGAGKTTTFRLILDFLTQDQGEVLWNGHHLGEKDYDVIGYLPEERGLYPKVFKTNCFILQNVEGNQEKRLNQKSIFGWKNFR